MTLALTTVNKQPQDQQLSMTPDVMKMLMQYTNMFAEASIIPDHYRGRKGDIFIAVQTAHRMNLDPMAVMQGTYVIHGKLGMTSAFAISLANTSGLLKSGICYHIEGVGNDLRVTAKATLRSNDQEITYSIGMKEANAEGWSSKNGSKYKTMPELMLRYRAATLLIRTHMPEVLNGMRMTEEIEDVHGSKMVNESKSANLLQTKNALDNFIDDEDDDLPIAATPVVEHDKNDLVLESTTDLAQLKRVIAEGSVTDTIIEKWCKAGGVATIDELSDDKIVACIDYIEHRMQAKEINNIQGE